MRKVGRVLWVTAGMAFACSGESTRSGDGSRERKADSMGGSNVGGADDEGGARATGGEAGSRAGSGGKGGRSSGGSGGSGASSGGAGEGGEGGADECDCRGLIGVRPDARVRCVNGACSLEPEDCLDGRADCNGDALDGCEIWTDFDLSNCGACGNVCSGDRACTNGVCAFDRCIPGFEHCSGDSSCQPLDSDPNCGACGREACAFQGAVGTCSAGTACKPPLCVPGFANCSGDHACETPITQAGPGCFPTLVSNVTFDVAGPYIHAALGDDGTTILGGTFQGQGDFDPTNGEDIRDSFDTDGNAFVTKLTPGGGYGWTATLDGSFGWISNVKLAGDGSVVVTGGYGGVVDFNPGPGIDQHETPLGEAFVMKFRPDGGVAWLHRFVPQNGASYSSSADVALDATGAIYASGLFLGAVDFAPGVPGGERVTERVPGSFDELSQKSYLVKLASDGTYVWSFAEVGGCNGVADGVSVSGNAVWLGGTVSGACDYPGGSTTDDTYGSYITNFTLGGGSGGFGLIEDTMGGARVATTPSSVFLFGVAQAEVDLDPTGGVDRRLAPESNVFAVKLDATGNFLWAQTFGRYRTYIWPDVAASRSGGLLVPSTGPWLPDASPSPVHGVLFFVKADESPGFTLDLGTHAAPHTVAVGGGELVVGGHLEDDLYVGTGSGRFFLTRYAFEAD